MSHRGFAPSRLRAGEVIAALGGGLLLVFMFALKWYALNHGATSWTGWHELSIVRWLLVVTAGCAILLAYFQVTRPAPALPVTLSLIVTLLGVLSTIALVVRVLIAPPSSLDPLAGAYLGLCAALAVAYGGHASMRQEGGADPAELGEIETITL